jgi:hypothetical protein
VTDDDTLRQQAAPPDSLSLWEVPAWMERYRPLVGQTGGNSLEELLQRLDTEKNLIRTNLPVFVLAVAVQAQVHLLQRLHREGLLP